MRGAGLVIVFAAALAAVAAAISWGPESRAADAVPPGPVSRLQAIVNARTDHGEVLFLQGTQHVVGDHQPYAVAVQLRRLPCTGAFGVTIRRHVFSDGENQPYHATMHVFPDSRRTRGSECGRPLGRQAGSRGVALTLTSHEEGTFFKLSSDRANRGIASDARLNTSVLPVGGRHYKLTLRLRQGHGERVYRWRVRLANVITRGS